MKSSKKIAGVILAAGASTRMGRTKQLLPFKGDTLLGHVVKTAKASLLNEVIVVIGHDADAIKKEIDLTDTKVVLNPFYQKGQSTSLIKGLENISSTCDAVMFLLADQPFVSTNTINTLIKAFNTSNAPVIIPYCNKKRGNPVILARSLFHRLTSLSADAGARVLFNEFSASVLKVSISDKGVLTDVDTMDDYKKLILKKNES